MQSDMLRLVSSFIDTKLTLKFSMQSDTLGLVSSFIDTKLSLRSYASSLIRKFIFQVEREEWKLDTLCDLYKTLTITQVVILCNTRRKVEWLTEKMHARDFTVSAIVSGFIIIDVD